jgi:hypothetical protein
MDQWSKGQEIWRKRNNQNLCQLYKYLDTLADIKKKIYELRDIPLQPNDPYMNHTVSSLGDNSAMGPNTMQV